MSTHHLMSLTPRISPRAVRRIAAACGTGVLLIGATACGSSGGATPNTQGGPEGTFQNGQGSTSRGSAGRFPGTSGKVVAITGSTAQVQNAQDGQVGVTWTGSTTFTQQVRASLADVQVGSCVMVSSADASTAPSTAPSAAPTAVTAGTVRIAAKSSDGTCAGGLGGPGGPGGGDRPQLSGNGAPGGAPNGVPNGVPSGAPGGGNGAQFRGFGGTFGEVTAVSAGSFTVKSTVPQFNGSSSTPSTQEATVTVSLTGSTTYTKTGRAAAADVVVGVCMRAEGTTDSTGALSAKTIALSPATDGGCETTFRRLAGPGGPGAATQES